MGFPIGYTELLLPKFLIHTLSILSFLRQIINTLFRYLGLPDFLEPDISWSSPSSSGVESSDFPDSPAAGFPNLERSMSAVLIREVLPVVKFSELVDPPESCAVCLYDFEEEDEIRNLANCRHVFHRSCLDRWMGYDRRTCPLCRTAVIPDDVQESFNEKFWAASGIPDFYGEFSQFAE
ncbi:Brassinosteroid-responsive RING protein 1 [Linum perenne]